MGDHGGNSEGERPDIGALDRRTMLKRGIAATGVAWAAPQVLSTAVAGAQTSTCFNIKFGEADCEAELINGGDQTCTDYVPIPGAGGTLNDGVAMVTLPSQCNESLDLSMTITCPAGTIITMVRGTIKAGSTECLVVPPADITIGPPNVAHVRFQKPAPPAISHMDIGWCCESGS